MKLSTLISLLQEKQRQTTTDLEVVVNDPDSLGPPVSVEKTNFHADTVQLLTGQQVYRDS